MSKIRGKRIYADGGNTPNTQGPVDPNTGLTEYKPRKTRGKQLASFTGPSANRPSTFDAEQYSSYLGIPVSPSTPVEPMMANAQGFFTEAGNAIAQTVTTAAGQMIEGAGYLLDLIPYVETPLDEGGRAIQEFGREQFPIMSAGESNRESFFANIPSVASSLSLLIPAMGATSLASRAFGLGNKLTQLAAKAPRAAAVLEMATPTISTAFLSRHMESKMEAAGIYESEYNKLLETVDPETGQKFDPAKANLLAKEASDKTYWNNMPLMLLDTYQFAALLKPFRGLGKVGQAIEKSPWYIRKPISLAPHLSEGLEEGLQYIIGEEATHGIEVKAGIAEANTFGDRLAEYTKADEFWSGVFYGSLGSAAMQSKVGQAITNKATALMGSHYNNPDFYFNVYEYNRLNKALQQAEESGETDVADYIRDQIIARMGITSAKLGKGELADLTWDTLKGATEEEIDKFGFSSELKNRIPEFKDKMNRVINLYNQSKLKVGENLAEVYATNEFLIENLNKQIENYDQQINQIQSKYAPVLSKLSSTGREIFDLNSEFQSLKKQRDILSASISNMYDQGYTQSTKKLKKEVAHRYNIEQRMDALDSMIKELKKSYEDKLDKKGDLDLLKDLEYPVDLTKLKVKKDLATDSLTRKLARNLEIEANSRELDKQAATNVVERQAEEIQTEPQNVVNEVAQTTTSPEVKQTAEDIKQSIEDKQNLQKTDEPSAEEFPAVKQRILDLINGPEYNKYLTNFQFNSFRTAGFPNINDFNLLKLVRDQLTTQSPQWAKDLVRDIDNILATRKLSVDESKTKEEAVQLEDPSIIEEAYTGTDQPDELISEPTEEDSIVTTDTWFLKQHQFQLTANKPDPAKGERIDLGSDGKSLYDWEFLNNPNNVLPGTEVNFIVDTEYSYNKNYALQYVDEFVIFATVKVGEEYKLLGKVPSSDKVAGEEGNRLRAFRQAVLDEVHSQTGTKIISKYTSRVSNKLGGRLWNTDTYNKPNDILAEGEELIFGVGVEDKSGNKDILFNNTEVVKKYLPRYNRSKVRVGKLYQLVKTSNGNYIPSTVLVKKLRDQPETLAKVQELFRNYNKTNAEDTIRKIGDDVYVRFYFPNERQGDYSTISYATKQKDANDKLIYTSTSLEDFLTNILPNYMMQVSRFEINQGDYNSRINDGRLSTNLRAGTHTHSTKFQIDALITREEVKEETATNKVQEVIDEVQKENVIKREWDKLNKDKLPDISIDLDQDPNFTLGNNALVEDWNTLFSKVFNNSTDPISSKLVIRRLIDNGFIIPKDPLYKLAEKVIQANARIEFHSPTEDEDDRYWMHIKGSKITINQDRLGQFNFTQSLLHELVHYYTLEELRKGKSEFETEMFRIYVEASDYFIYDKSKWYGFAGGLEEFVSEIMTNSEFTDAIKAKALPLWKRIINAITRLLIGKEIYISDASNLISRANNAVYDLIDSKNTIGYEPKDSDIHYRRPDGFTPEQWNSSVRMVNWVILDKIIPAIRKLPEYNGLTTVEIFNKFGIRNIFEKAQESLEDLRKKSTKEGKSNVAYLGAIVDNFFTYDEKTDSVKLGRLAQSSVDRLRAHGIKINLGNLVAEESNSFEEDEDPEMIEEETTLESWQDEPYSKSVESKISTDVKVALSFIYEVDPTKTTFKVNEETGNKEKAFEFKRDEFGMFKFVEVNEIVRYLTRNLAGMTSTEEMWERLEELKKAKPEVHQIIKLLKNNPSLKSKFYVNMANQQLTVEAAYEKVEVDSNDYNVTNKVHRLISMSQTNTRTILIDEWKYNYYSNKPDSDKAQKIKRDYEALVSEFRNDAKTGGKLNQIQINKFTGALKSIGINISPITIKDYYESVGHQSFLSILVQDPGPQVLIDNIAKGVDIFSEGANVDVAKSLNFLADMVRSIELDLQQSVVRTVLNKNMYTFFAPNFISRMVSNMRRDFGAVKRFLKQDAFYKDMFLLTELEKDSNYRDKFGYSVIGGQLTQGQTGVDYTNLGESGYEQMAITAFLNNFRAVDVDNKKNALGYGKYIFPVASDAPVCPAFTMKRYTQEEIMRAFETVYLQEVARMKHIEALKKNDKTKDFKVTNWSDKQDQFVFLPELNDFNVKKAADIATFINARMNAVTDKAIEDWIALGLIRKDDKGVLSFTDKVANGLKTLANTEDVREAVKFYLMNRRLANIQMMQLIDGDLAFYTDFTKRNKQGWTPVQQLDVEAIGRSTYNVLYIKDKKKGSIDHAAIRESVEADENTHDNPELVKATSTSYKDGEIDETDAQAWNRLSKIKDILVGRGEWNSTYERAFEFLERGEELPEDLKGKIVLNPKKPFVYNIQYLDAQKLVLPSQNKNSEAALLPYLFQTVDGKIKSQKLYAFERIGKALSIDTIMVTSAVKVGAHNVIPMDEILRIGELGEEEFLKEVENLKSKVVQQPYSDYGIVSEVPSHLEDYKIRLGSQLAKLTMADLDMTITDENKKDKGYKLGDRRLTAKEVFNLYNAVQVANIEEDYEKARQRTSAKELLRTLIEAAKDRGLGEYAIDALRELPAYHPVHSKKNENMFTAIYKNLVTIRRIRGAQLVQMSAFGFTENEAEAFGLPRPKVMLNNKGQITQAEVLMPWWTKDMIKDPNKIDPKLLEAVGFRIPTEDMYSWMSFKVVGFLPQEMGNVIMLPREVTKIDGSDFDVDKKYILLYDWKKKTLYKDLSKALAKDTSLAEYNTLVENLRMIDETPVEFRNDNDKFIFNKMEEIRNSHSKLVKVEMRYNDIADLNDYKAVLEYVRTTSRSERDNAIIDLIRSVQLHPNSYVRSMKAGGPHRLTKMADILRGSGNLDLTQSEIQRDLYNRVMAGKALIGVFANHNTNHAVLQWGKVQFNPDLYIGAYFDNEEIKFKLDNIFSDKKNTKRISEALAEFLSAAVDNAKDPIFSYLNINFLTADMVAMLVRMGVDLKTAIGFIRQPIIADLAKEYFNLGGKSWQVGVAVNNVTTRYQNKLGGKYQAVTRNFGKTELWNNIEKADKNSDAFLQSQLDALKVFVNLKEMADALATLVSAMRVDTNGSGPTISANLARIDKIDQFIGAEVPKFIGTTQFFIGDTYPMIKAHYEFGLLAPTQDALKIFPWNAKPLRKARKVLSETKGQTLNEAETETLNYHYMTFLAGDFEFFKVDFKERQRLESLYLQLQDWKAKYPENALLKRLSNKGTDISFFNVGKLTDIERQNIMDAWESLLYSTDEATKKFAEDLAKYTYAQSGMTYGPFSFTHLLPIRFWTDLTDSTGLSFTDYLKSKLENPSQEDILKSDIFIKQFVRNNYYEHNYLQKVDVRNISFEAFENGVVAIFTVKDKNEIKKLTIGEDNWVRFVKLGFGTEAKNSYIYEHLGNGVYGLINKLGVPNSRVEYRPDESNAVSVYDENITQASNPVGKWSGVYGRADYQAFISYVKDLGIQGIERFDPINHGVSPTRESKDIKDFADEVDDISDQDAQNRKEECD